MSFSSKRLRVQLPCGDRTVVEVAIGCPERMVCHDMISFPCDPNTCVFGRQSQVGPEGQSPCDFGTMNCVSFGSDPGPIRADLVLDAEQLSLLKTTLEAQLEEIDKAEEALKEKGVT